MKLLRFVALALCVTAGSLAQTATLTSDTSALAPSGGSVALTATVAYDGEPGAIGWSIELPADWSLVSITGPNVPAIAPDTGASGTLEFAYTAVPASRAAFTVTVRYPAGAASAVATSTVLLRSGGKLTTLRPEAPSLRSANATAGQ
jgi:hypothetical protein